MADEANEEESSISTPNTVNTLNNRSILALHGFASIAHRFAVLRQASLQYPFGSVHLLYESQSEEDVTDLRSSTDKQYS